MKIYNDDKKIYIECSIDEAYSPTFETKYQKTLKELDTIKNIAGHYKGKVTSAYYNITKDIVKAKEICGIITCSLKSELLEIIDARGVLDRKMEDVGAKVSKISYDIGEKYGIGNPVYQLEFSAEHYCDEETFRQIKEIRPISRYRVENGEVVAELRQKMDRITKGNEYSAHIQLANALSKGLELPVKLRSEIRSDYATEIITNERENITSLHLSSDSKEEVTLGKMNRELEKWNSCQSKIGTSLDVVMGSPSSKIIQNTKGKETSVIISDSIDAFHNIAFSYKIPNEDLMSREVVVKHIGDIRFEAGEIEKNCRATVSYVSKKNFTAPMKMIFKEECTVQKPKKEKAPRKGKSKDYNPKTQQRLI